MPSLSRGQLIRAGTAALAFAPIAARAQSDPLHLRVGTGSVEANAQIFYAADMGFFKKNGLDVDVQKLRSGTTTMAAIVGGDLQCGVANVLSLVAGGVWGQKNQEQAAVILAKWTGAKEAHPKIRFATKLDPAQIQPVYDSAAKYKLLAGPVNASEFSWNGK